MYIYMALKFDTHPSPKKKKSDLRKTSRKCCQDGECTPLKNKKLGYNNHQLLFLPSHHLQGISLPSCTNLCGYFHPFNLFFLYSFNIQAHFFTYLFSQSLNTLLFQFSLVSLKIHIFQFDF